MNSPFIFRFSTLADFLNGDQPKHEGEIIYLTDSQEMYCWTNNGLRRVQYVYTGSNTTYPTRYDPPEYISSFQYQWNSAAYWINYSDSPILMNDLPEIDNERLGELL